MDEHWHFTHFDEADTARTIAAIHICAHGDLVDGQPPPTTTEPEPPTANEDDVAEAEPVQVVDGYFDYDDDDMMDYEDTDMMDSPYEATTPLSTGNTVTTATTTAAAAAAATMSIEEEDDNPPAASPPPLLANHWTIALELCSPPDSHCGRRGIKLDMSPGYQEKMPYREGTILVSSFDWKARTTSSGSSIDTGADSDADAAMPAAGDKGDMDSGIVKSQRFATLISGATVEQVIENLDFNTRHRYRFSGEGGEGSRFWVYTVVGDLERAGLLADGAAERTAELVSWVWGAEGSGGVVKKEVTRGLFTKYLVRPKKRVTAVWNFL